MSCGTCSPHRATSSKKRRARVFRCRETRRGRPSPYDAGVRGAEQQRAGVICAASAFFMWGLFPLYWKPLAPCRRSRWWPTARSGASSRWRSGSRCSVAGHEARAVARPAPHAARPRRQRHADRRQLAPLHLGGDPRPRRGVEPRLLHQPSRQRAARRPRAARAARPRCSGSRWRSPRPGWRSSPSATAASRGSPSALAVTLRPVRPGPQDGGGRCGRPACSYETAILAPLARRLSSCCSRPAAPAPSATAARPPTCCSCSAGAVTAVPLVLFALGARRLPLSTVGLPPVHLAELPVPPRGAPLPRAVHRRRTPPPSPASGPPWRC